MSHPPAGQGTSTMQHLSEAVRSRKTLRNIDLGACQLNGLGLHGLRAEDLTFSRGQLKRVMLREAHLTGCTFEAADLDFADMTDAVLRQCCFDSARARSMDLRGARLEDSSIERADLTGTCLRQARLTESSFARSCLSSANLDEARGDGVCFRGADLQDASMRKSSFLDADLRGANLTNADLSGGDFRGADFRGATLNGARWEGANLRRAWFDIDAEPKTQPQAEPTRGDSYPEAETQRQQGNRRGVDPQALADALSSLIKQMVGAAPAGLPLTRRQLEAVRTQWAAWRSANVSSESEDVAQLLAALERAFAGSKTLPTEPIRMLSGLLASLNEASTDEPPEEWKALLTKLFPDLAQTDDPAAMEALAARLAKTLQSMRGA